MNGRERLCHVWNNTLFHLRWKLRSSTSFSSSSDLQRGSEHPDSSQPQISSSPYQLSPLASLCPSFPHFFFSSPTTDPFSLQNERQQLHASFNWGFLGLIVIAIQFGWIVGLVQVALVKELAASWLRLPLIASFFLITIALLLSLHWMDAVCSLYGN